jgi:DNA-binding transcriptional LysR family regulator
LDQGLINGFAVLSAIVDTGSFARAAEVLDVSPSGVSRAVARLEAHLGVRLLDRTTRSVVLSDEGRRLIDSVGPLLQGIEEAISTVATGAAAVRGRLRINVDPFFSRLILGPRLGQFLAQHPLMQLDLVTRDHQGDLVAEGFDLAVRFGFPPSSSLVARKLLDTRIITVAAPAYLAAHGHPAHPHDLLDHACVQFRNPTTGRPFPWEFHRGEERLSFETSGPLTVNDVGTLYSVILAGVGIGQIMTLGAENYLSQGTIIDVFPEWPDERFPLYALYPSRKYLPAKTAALLEFLSQLQ